MPNMTEFLLIGLSGPSSLLSVRPGWRAVESRQRFGATHRSRSGALHGCGWGAWFRVELPLAQVEPEAREALARWWREQARLAWVRIDGQRIETQVVRIADGPVPLGRRHAPEGARYLGAVTLHGLSPGTAPLAGAPLILDHAAFGTLDTHNLLL